MLIIGADKQVIINVDNFTEIRLHDGSNRVLCEKTTGGPQRSIGDYDSLEKTKRAFGFLTRAILEGEVAFAMPSNDDERLNTNMRNTGGFRTTQTNGKTK